MRVTIRDGFAVVFDGEQGHEGETIDVDDDLGTQWVAQGIATEVEAEPEASMKRPAKAPARKRT